MGLRLRGGAAEQGGLGLEGGEGPGHPSEGARGQARGSGFRLSASEETLKRIMSCELTFLKHHSDYG